MDPHKGKLEKCETCHQSSNWRTTRTFDHDKTKFKIEGAHKDVRCGTCHVGEIYKDLDRTCVSCHRIQDVHNTRYGVKCENCHDQAKWKNAKYDHDKTKFPLRNAHAKVKCDTCHPGHVYDDKLEIGCVSCHQQQDPHTGQLGAKCEQCHNDAEWKKIRFDHNLTRFPLVGAHAPVKCTACHLSFHYKDTPIACEGCHKDSRHQGRLGASAKCSTCHSPMGWARWEYDHAKQANFPLTGAHRKLICEACHAVANPPSLKLPNVCEKCHKDFHQGRLGAVPKCGSCHDTERWTKGRYDHAKQANYPLIGHHAKITCETCHKEKNPASLKLPTDCHACHRQDDAHKGAFGTNCGRCHTPEDWKKVSIKN